MKKAIVLLAAIFAMTIGPIQTVQANYSNSIAQGSSGISTFTCTTIKI